MFTKLNSNYIYFAAIVFIVAVTWYIHIVKIDQIPSTLFLDETSIGHNAALIAKTGVDEHGARYPIFFKAFGEYKNPMYIYTNALIFKIFGVSNFNLRINSFLYFVVLQISFVLLVYKYFKRRGATIYALIAISFVPWIFTISRISFEVISQPALFSLFLLFLYLGFKSTKPDRKLLLYTVFAGVCLGLLFYTYSTSRLLVPIYAVLTCLVYLKKEYIFRLLILALSSLITAIPYFWFYFNNKAGLTSRFEEISFFYNKQLTNGEKANIFYKNFLAHFSLEFFVQTGDRNLRHSTGYMGEIFIIIFALFLVGMGVLIFKYYKERFLWLLFIMLALTPVAASMTIDNMHSLRTATMPILIIFISCLPFTLLKEKSHKILLYSTVLICLILESFLYLNHYFVKYPAISRPWFGGPNLQKPINQCLKEGSGQIVISTNAYDIDKQYFYHMAPNKIVYVSTVLNNEQVCCVKQNTKTCLKRGFDY